jgi:two-component system NtrC family sensor kinase
VLVPLVFQTRLAGLFLLADKMAGGDFSPDDLEFLSGLGNQISVAIENARLYEAEKSAIQQLRAAQQQLVQSERLAALGEMSAKIAHEVNNPLGIIKNYILLLQRAGAAGADAKEYTEIVGQEIDRIASIVRQLREYQRPVRVQPEPVDVRKIMEDTLRLMERQLQTEEISLVREFDEGEFIIEGCADSVKQVFLNLIINARAEMDDGGTLTISMKRRGKDLVVQIRDTGRGIPAEIIPRIFEPFFTTKGDKGTGLGLSVCYGIINSLSGSITYENREVGGCFEIALPLVDERTEDGGEV